jgi:hypothetical protein
VAVVRGERGVGLSALGRDRQRAQETGKSLIVGSPTMLTGQTRYGTELLRVPGVDKSGRTLSIAFTVALLHSEDGKPVAIAAIIRDETTRFNEERNLRKRLADLEARLAECSAAP